MFIASTTYNKRTDDFSPSSRWNLRKKTGNMIDTYSVSGTYAGAKAEI